MIITLGPLPSTVCGNLVNVNWSSSITRGGIAGTDSLGQINY